MWRGCKEIAFLAGYFELASALETITSSSASCCVSVGSKIAKVDGDAKVAESFETWYKIYFLSPIRMRQKYTCVNILRCANFTRGKQMAHANANTHRSIFTYG